MAAARTVLGPQRRNSISAWPAAIGDARGAVRAAAPADGRDGPDEPDEANGAIAPDAPKEANGANQANERRDRASATMKSTLPGYRVATTRKQRSL
jgi:hypothetical protein